MIKKMIIATGIMAFIFGAMGIAGAIENDINPTASILIALYGAIVMGVTTIHENRKVNNRSDDNRLYFLP